MQIKIISIGKLSADHRKLADHYRKMIKWKLQEVEITYGKKLPEPSIVQYEAGLIRSELSNGAYLIVLDLTGKQLSSKNFTEIFTQSLMIGRNIDFIIGGAFGLDGSIVKDADLVLSLSLMTLPHQMAKLLLLEQIYRAQTIYHEHPYHK